MPPAVALERKPVNLTGLLRSTVALKLAISPVPGSIAADATVGSRVYGRQQDAAAVDHFEAAQRCNDGVNGSDDTFAALSVCLASARYAFQRRGHRLGQVLCKGDQNLPEPIRCRWASDLLMCKVMGVGQHCISSLMP